MATVTLSACYGSVCTATITLPDGGQTKDLDSRTCQPYDCTKSADGGAPVQDAEWQSKCK